jgi:hypothetical protein
MKIEMRFALAIVSVILVVSLAANGYLYFSTNSQVAKFQSQVASLESQTAALQSQLENIQNNSGSDNQTIAYLNAQILDLQTQNENLLEENDNLTAKIQNLQNKPSSDIYEPYLVTALGATFTWSYSESARYGMLHYLYVQGTVTNAGNGTAYNCALKVVMNIASGLSITDYYRFNALAPGETENVDTHFYYDNLQSWTITPECTNKP